MVQWLRLHASTEEGTSSIPHWRTKIPHSYTVALKKKKKKGSSGLEHRSENITYGDGEVLAHLSVKSSLGKNDIHAPFHRLTNMSVTQELGSWEFNVLVIFNLYPDVQQKPTF